MGLSTAIATGTSGAIAGVLLASFMGGGNVMPLMIFGFLGGAALEMGVINDLLSNVV